ncbi:MAG: hypothetical protein DMH00_02645, partial [Acidobacteria bacterium]
MPTRSGNTGPVGGNNESFNPAGPLNFEQDASNGTFNSLELYQGWIALDHIRGSSFSLKFGRQEIVKGSEMLLGDKDFYNGISHDGVVGHWDWKKLNLDAWYTRPFQSAAVTNIFGTTIPDHQSVNFYGAWAQWNQWASKGMDVAAYAMLYDDGTQAITPSRRAFWTLGGRTGRNVTGKNGFNWNAELAWQTGDQQDVRAGSTLGDTIKIKATGFEGMIGYNLHSGSTDQQFQVSYARASGDDDATDGDAKAFDPLFQDSHDRYGFADLFNFSDLVSISAGYHII